MPALAIPMKTLGHHGAPRYVLAVLQANPRNFPCAALAVMHYRNGRLEEAQDMYARAYETQVGPCLTACC